MMAKIEWTNEEGAFTMKGICAMLSAVLIIAGIWLGKVESPSQPDVAEVGALYVGDFAGQSLPAQAKHFGREKMRAEEVLSARLPMDGYATTLSEVLSDEEYEIIYLSLLFDEGQEEDYWAIVKLIRQTQPQASIYLLGLENHEFLQKISDGRNIFHIDKL